MHENMILNHLEIQHKTERIAYQIYENFVADRRVIIAGISGGGYILAKRIYTRLQEINELNLNLCEVFINKKSPLQPIKTSIPATDYKESSVVLVDDVLNSGTTLIYGVKHFLEVPLKKLKTAVLVDRNHKKFPIKADFKGISLSTSIQEHVKVCFSKTDDYAYLI